MTGWRGFYFLGTVSVETIENLYIVLDMIMTGYYDYYVGILRCNGFNGFNCKKQVLN